MKRSLWPLSGEESTRPEVQAVSRQDAAAISTGDVMLAPEWEAVVGVKVEYDWVLKMELTHPKCNERKDEGSNRVPFFSVGPISG